MMSLFERWCFEWGRIGRVHMALSTIGYDGPTWEKSRFDFARDMLLWGEASVRIPGPLWKP